MNKIETISTIILILIILGSVFYGTDQKNRADDLQEMYEEVDKEATEQLNECVEIGHKLARELRICKKVIGYVDN